MAKMNLSLPHTLPQEEALGRIKGLLDDMKGQYADKISDLKENWKGHVGTFSFSVMGMAVTGTLTVGPRSVDLDGTLPFMASMFKDKIESTLREHGMKLLAP